MALCSRACGRETWGQKSWVSHHWHGKGDSEDNIPVKSIHHVAHVGRHNLCKNWVVATRTRLCKIKCSVSLIRCILSVCSKSRFQSSSTTTQSTISLFSMLGRVHTQLFRSPKTTSVMPYKWTEEVAPFSGKPCACTPLENLKSR